MIFRRDTQEDETIVSMLASALRRDISFGALRPDEKLKIQDLRTRYGGSNHSMRETLRMLVAEGLVEATNQRGFRVMSATEEDLQDILLMRLETEKLGLSRSMARGDVAWEARVVAALHALSRAEAAVQENPDDVTALEWDEACRAATETLLSACGSPRLIQMADKFYNQSRRFRLTLLREGRVDFKARAERLEKLQRAVLAREATVALALLEDDVRADLGI
ncbi:MAG: GntR family transcriptional regulator [Pseudomonadota bacterium]